MSSDIKNKIISTIRENFGLVRAPLDLDRRKLLWSLAGCESSFGDDIDSHYESAYDIGGRYYNDQIKHLKGVYGREVCCSQGVFQLLYITAYELGYRGQPFDLKFPEIQIVYVIEYINKRLKGFGTIEQFADGYNSGNFKDKNIPEKYIEKFCNIYYNTNEDIFK